MSKTEKFDNLLSQAITEHMNEWLESDEFREDEFKTSEEFEKKMEKMIKSEHNVFHKLTLTRARKVMCIAAIIVALLLSSLSVGATRDFVAGFFVKHHKHPDRLEELYQLSNTPKGYKCYSGDLSADKRELTYDYYSKDDTMIFSQYTVEAFESSVESEYTNQAPEVYEEKEYYVKEHNDGSYTIIWDNYGYVFSLVADLPKDTILDLCNSLKIADNEIFS